MSSNSSSNGTGGGIGFAGLLTIVFVTLKLLKKIDWPWVWVLAPAWIPAALVAGVLLMAVLIALVKPSKPKPRGRYR